MSDLICFCLKCLILCLFCAQIQSQSPTIQSPTVGIYIYKLILLVIIYQHLKPGTQIFGHLISEFYSFILI